MPHGVPTGRAPRQAFPGCLRVGARHPQTNWGGGWRNIQSFFFFPFNFLHFSESGCQKHTVLEVRGFIFHSQMGDNTPSQVHAPLFETAGGLDTTPPLPLCVRTLSDGLGTNQFHTWRRTREALLSLIKKNQTGLKQVESKVELRSSMVQGQREPSDKDQCGVRMKGDETHDRQITGGLKRKRQNKAAEQRKMKYKPLHQDRCLALKRPTCPGREKEETEK